MQMSEARITRVIDALGKRISEQGDMQIRVSRLTLKAIRQVLGMERWEDQDDFREVDAMALDMLRHLAWQHLSVLSPESHPA